MSDSLIALAAKPAIGGRGRKGPAGSRFVRTPEGAEKYGLPIGARITRDAELRAKSRGRSYGVPEDDPRFGGQEPAQGRQRRAPGDVVRGIRSQPAPNRVTPEGPKKVAVGTAGFGFPEGSRVFRPNGKENFAVVRKPDYDLVGVTDKGIAFDITGDLEKELNEELDDLDVNGTGDWAVDDPPDPNQLADVDGDGETGESQPVDAMRTGRVEDSAGYLSEDHISEILAGMEGADQATRDAVELQLRRNNGRIRSEWEATAPNTPAQPEPAAPDADKPEQRDSALETPTVEEDGTPKVKPETKTATSDSENEPDVPPLPKKPASKAREIREAKRKESEPEGSVEDLEELASGRPSGVAEGKVKGTPVQVRRNRVNNAMEYSADGRDGKSQAFEQREELDSFLDQQGADAETEEQIERGSVVTLPNGRRGLVVDGPDDAGRVSVHTGDRGRVSASMDEIQVEQPQPDPEIEALLSNIDRTSSPTANRNRRLDSEREVAEYLRSTGEVQQSAAAPQTRRERRMAARAAQEDQPRDTTALPPEDLSDEELDALLDDINDFLATNNDSVVTERRDELQNEYQRRNDSARFEEDPPEREPVEAPEIESAPEPDDEGYSQLAERSDILNARPGDAFMTRTNDEFEPEAWSVEADGTFRSSVDDEVTYTREEFADLIEEMPNVEFFTHDRNSANTAERPRPEPGDVATRDYVDSAEPGSAVATSDNLVGQKNEDGTWNTAIGTVDADFLDDTGVETDDVRVVQDGPDDDGRPVGATQELLTIEDMDDVSPGDGVVVITPKGNRLDATRRPDGQFDVDVNGMQLQVDAGSLMGGNGARSWHVPNRDLTGNAPESPKNTNERLDNLDEVWALPSFSRLKVRRGVGENEEYTLLPDGRIRHDAQNVILPASRLKRVLAQGRVRVLERHRDEDEEPDLPEPRVVENLEDYQTGDAISTHRHIRDMRAGQQVTLVVPATRNGGQEAHVVLTRTNDEDDLGGFMFLVGNGGRGYNSFGENNATLFQAIHEGNLYFGNLETMDSPDAPRIEGDWSRERNIAAWEGGPMLSEYDLRTYIASQVAANAMQKSYFDPELLPEDSPFRSAQLRRDFATKAKDKFSTPGNPMRSKPASIRYAADLLGLQYTDPGSTLLPDNLTVEDFNTRVQIGRWLRRSGTPAENNMGPEQLTVTRADLKTALAAMDNMLEREDGTEDPDVILKRVFARQGSPLQDLNTSVAIAAYFGMKRYRINEDGSRTPMTTIARQNDKRRNKALFRQMLLEQLEGRPPGYYGLPEDEEYTRGRDNKRFINVSTLNPPEGSPQNPVTDEDYQQALDQITPEPVDGGSVNDGVVEPEPTPDYAERLDELDDFDNARDAYMNARERADASRYIVQVLGDEGLNEVTDGNATLREQFTQAWNQRNGRDDPGSGPAENPPADSGNERGSDENGSQINRGDRVPPSLVGALPTGSVILYPRSSGGTSRYTRRDDGWYSERGNILRVDPSSFNERTQFTVESLPGQPAERTPDVSSTPRPETSAEPTFQAISAPGDLLQAAEGTRVRITSESGVVNNFTVRINDGGESVLINDDEFSSWRASTNSPERYRTLRDERYTIEIEQTAAPDGPQAPWPTGGRFSGQDIRQAPPGSHVRGASGREYRVMENGNLYTLGSGVEIQAEAVERHNAEFTYLSATAPNEPMSSLAQTAPDVRVGSAFPPDEIMSLPEGHFFRSRGGTVWQRRGTYLVSITSGRRSRIRNLPADRNFRYLGASLTGQQTSAVPQSTRPLPTLESAGLTRVPRADIERYDRPRPLPAVGFDRTNSDPITEYLNTPQGSEDLRKTLLAALPQGSSVSVRAHGGGFTASYRTPDGATGSMDRSIYERDGELLISNDVARAGGASFAAVQDHLFAFYRQHGVDAVVVHGLSSGSTWNGGHTWIRRGFRPNPNMEYMNWSNLERLQGDLARIVSRTRNGEYPQFTEFLEEAQELSARMTQLLNNRNNMEMDERLEALYQAWRDLTYLGEVRNAQGKTVRGQRTSIGWLLLGRTSGSVDYYGRRSLADYFE